jgi:hypothetical protein
MSKEKNACVMSISVSACISTLFAAAFFAPTFRLRLLGQKGLHLGLGVNFLCQSVRFLRAVSIERPQLSTILGLSIFLKAD